jgi:hypothetical protein
MKEHIHYEITKGSLTIRKEFTIKEHQKPAQAIERVRREVYAHLMGDELRLGYKALIDAVATWLSPDKDMAASRQKTEKQVLKYVTETYKPYNDTELKVIPNWMQDISALIEDKERKGVKLSIC